jgi:hypothetical protein
MAGQLRGSLAGREAAIRFRCSAGAKFAQAVAVVPIRSTRGRKTCAICNSRYTLIGSSRLCRISTGAIPASVAYRMHAYDGKACLPCRDRLLGHPHGQASTLDQRRVVFRPVRDPVFGLGDLVAAAFVELVRHGSHRQRTATDRTAPASTLPSAPVTTWDISSTTYGLFAHQRASRGNRRR